MYECPNCGGNLSFDIASQQLACAYCSAQFDPYAITKDKDAEERGDYEVTVFTCPQCGGEIYSTDNTAAGFCSFCGASTILDSRISRENRPAYIIPFKKTKEDCKAQYLKRVKRAVFAPGELKNPKHIDEFRGIYMPYWVYHFTQKGPMDVEGTKAYRRGDYIITEYYNITGNLDAYYKGLSYDASSSFADDISQRIAPYDVKNMKEFTPSILSGFYADTSDVEQGIYQEDAEEISNKQTREFLRQHPATADYTIKEYDNWSEKYHTQCRSAELAMFPVWFLAYRNKDRVAYATVNGQTGKVVSDLPVKLSKYLAASLGLAVPIFFLLNFFLTMVPSALLSVVSIICTAVALLYGREIKALEAKEGCEDDKGVQEARRKSQQIKWEAAAALEGEAPYVMPAIQAKPKRKNKVRAVLLGFLGSWTVLFCLGVAAALTGSSSILRDGRIIVLAASIVSGIAGIGSLPRLKKVEAKKGLPGILWVLLALLLALLVLFWKPVSDIYYYLAVVVCLAAVFFALMDLMICYNILATRRLPQFEYKGGDHRA